MNAEQYKRANNNSFYVCAVIIAAGLLMTINDIYMKGMTIGNIAIIGNALLGGAMISLGKFKFNTVKMGSILIMGGSTIFYFVLLIAEDNIVYFAFGLPILICSIIYLNVRLCKMGMTAITISFTLTCTQA